MKREGIRAGYNPQRSYETLDKPEVSLSRKKRSTLWLEDQPTVSVR